MSLSGAKVPGGPGAEMPIGRTRFYYSLQSYYEPRSGLSHLLTSCSNSEQVA